MQSNHIEASQIRRFEQQYEENPESFVFARLADAHRKAGNAERGLEILERGLADPDSLDAREQAQYVWLQRSYVNIYENLYQQYQRGACPAPFWEKFARELKQTLDSPGGRRFRAANDSYAELYAYVDAMPANDSQAYGWKLEADSEPTR